jgi:colanic acid/amylovoran biosynthesis glycosyltransferase
MFLEGRLGAGVSDPDQITIGYLASHYPAVSHTFIRREVAALRAAGVDVRTLSIHRASPDDLLTAVDRDADRETFAVLPVPLGRLTRCHVVSFCKSPAQYLSALARSQRASSPGLRARLWQFFYFAEAIVLHEHCEAAGVRHLHAHFADVATDVARIVTWRGGRSWSWSMALHGSVEFYDVQRNRLPEKIADAVLVRTISYFGRSQVLACVDEEHWPRVHMVRTGVDIAAYPAVEPPPADGEVRILCVGRLMAAKGQSLLIESVAELRRRGIQATAVIVGEGPNRARLEKLARLLGMDEHVKLTGALGQDQVSARYAECHIFCLPSFAEGLPVVLMEAMATGRPVVATSVMGIGELVTDRVHGRLVTPGCVNELTDALQELAEDEEARRRMGAAGRTRVLEHFDVQRSASQLRAIFARAVTV